MEKVRPWCGQPSDQGRLKNRTVATVCVTLKVAQGRLKRRSSMGRASQNAAESSAKRDFVEALIGTLHNVVRRVPTSRNSFRQNQAVDIVQKYRDVTEYPASLPINHTHTPV